MKKSPFFDFLNRHINDNFETILAKSQEDIDFLDWNGYFLPMAYGDEVAEYQAVRSRCALFDASPVKKYRITGTDAGLFLDTVLTRRVSRLAPMRVSYAVLCNEDGMLRDDGLLYKFSADDYLLMVSELDHDAHFAKVSHGMVDLKIIEMTTAWTGLAIQGPLSGTFLNLFGFAAIENLTPFEIKRYNFGGGEVTVARVGFTADLGYEVWFPPELINAVQKAIRHSEARLEIGIGGYGLKTLNALRIEGGFIVPGWDTAQTFEDIETERTPTELDIAWTVDLDRQEDFIGKSALLKERETGPRFETMGLTIAENIGKDSAVEDGLTLYTVIDGRAQEAGSLPSVAWSHGLDRWLGIASIKTEYIDRNLTYHLRIGDDQITCHPTKLPFVTYDRYRQVPAQV